MYAIKTLFDQPFRFFMTTLGIAFCMIIVLVLFGIYRGVTISSIEFIQRSDSDLWVMQRYSNNILRSTSLLRSRHARALEDTPGVKLVAPVLYLLGTVRLPQGLKTIYLTGYDELSGRGGPHRLASGRNIAKDREIVLDRSFAAKYGIGEGDQLFLKNDTMTVVGISDATNMFVVQRAFITLSDAYRFIGFAGIASCFELELEKSANQDSVKTLIREALTDVEVYDKNTFLNNNIKEMKSGILPIISVIATLCCVLLTCILSLILTIHVLERRKDFAIMKAIGAPGGFIPRLIVLQACILALCGILIAIACFFPFTSLIEHLAPEVSIMVSPRQMATVAIGVLLVSLVSVIFPNLKLRKIYPMEVFK
jgi:ABC-type antimicrobial peptide transport system permease subunit